MTQGFHNCKFRNKQGEIVNRKGNKRRDIYGSLEFQFMQKFNGFIEKHKVIHEKHIGGKTSEGSKTARFGFFADFYFPLKKLDLEISPAFHITYEKVAKRDLTRRNLLKSKRHVETMTLGALDLTDNRIDEIKAQIDLIDVSAEVLDYYT